MLLSLYPGQHFNRAFGVLFRFSHYVHALLQPVSVDGVVGHQLLVDIVLGVLLGVLVDQFGSKKRFSLFQDVI